MGTKRQTGVLVRLMIGLVVLGLVLAGGVAAAYVTLDRRAAEVTYQARLVSITASVGCLVLAREAGGQVVDTILDVAGGFGLPVPGGGDRGKEEVDAQGADGEHEDKRSSARDCQVQMTAGVEVSNPLPVGMDVQIVGAEVTVARSEVPDEAIEVTPRPIRAEAGGQAHLRVGVKLSPEQLMVAAGGMMMTRKVRVHARIEVEASILWGLIVRRRQVEIDRAMTMADIIRGVDGSVGAQ